MKGNEYFVVCLNATYTLLAAICDSKFKLTDCVSNEAVLFPS